MVKSRNQGFPDLTAPLTEKSMYKYSSQAKTWGSDFYLRELLFFLVFLSSVFLENISYKEKRFDS